ncbi:MAG: hypothetical protein ACP5UZ_03260 [Thermoplasmata archaeon]
MSAEEIRNLLEEFSARPYVKGSILTSKVGVPIASNEHNVEVLHLMAPLVSITCEGARELAAAAGQNFTQLDVELGNGSRIIIKKLKEMFLLAVELQRYDDKIQYEIDGLSNRVLEHI